LSLYFLWSFTKPNLSNWIVELANNFFRSGSPSPFMVDPSGIMISTLMFSGVLGSHWMNFVFRSAFGSSDMNDNVLGFIMSSLSDLKFSRCINL